MGARIHGADELIADLDSVPDRGVETFKKVVGRGAYNVKSDWKKAWEAIRAPRTHIPHLVRGIGYDVTVTGTLISAEIGVDPRNRQAFLSKIIEDGTLTSAPHPGPVPALDAEMPRFEAAVAKAAQELLEER
jgi:hypothetical protein